MSYKIAFLCLQAFLLQSISAQCISNAYENMAYSYAPYTPAAPYQTPCSYSPYTPSAGYNPAMLSASNGGGLTVTSSSPIAPYGVTMTSENAFEGPLAIAGQIPFLGAVGVEGNLPTAGAGAISYGCGNGNVAMIAEDLGAYSYGAVAPGYASHSPYPSYSPYGSCY